MSYFYELRSFNHKGECFDVREYDCGKVAYDKFYRFSSNAKRVHKRAKKAGFEPTFLAYKMQLVKRDENYLGLKELANWKVGA